MNKLVLASLLFASVALPAHATTYTDCARTPTAFTTTWHVDIVNGQSPANGGDGSAAHPWDSLQALLGNTRPVGWTRPMVATVDYDHHGLGTGLDPAGVRTGPDGPGFNMAQVQPGDQILLATGNYGSINIGTYALATYNVDASGNTKYIKIAPEPGATPVLATLAVGSARGWFVNGVTISSINGDGSAPNSGDLVHITDGGPTLPTMDINISNSTIGSALATPTKINPDGSYLSGWTKADWNTKGRNGVRIIGSDGVSTKCVAIVNNVVKYVSGGIAAAKANETTISQNIIDYFTGDAMDNYSNSYATWNGNNAEDRVDDGNGTHTDCLQLAFTTSDTSTFANPWHDVDIHQNSCTRYVHADNPFPGYLQGIFETNGYWDRVTIADNRVVSASCWGIALTATNSVVANNTVVRDGLPADQTPGCSGLLVQVHAPAEALGTPHTLVANNAVYGGYAQDANGVTWENNWAFQSPGGQSYLWNGTALVFFGSGTMNGVTLVNSLPDFSTVWASYAPPSSGISNPTSSPNLTPAVGGVLAGSGVSGPGIPTTNRVGVAFPTPTNIGAY